MDYMFLCPQGGTVYMDNKKLRGVMALCTFNRYLPINRSLLAIAVYNANKAHSYWQLINETK